ncbi:MAG: bifunctional proline dehydrogenase/L-glutamate gamma-semialdehyde dehydrogenase PutA [Rickettsiaceae bacterium]
MHKDFHHNIFVNEVDAVKEILPSIFLSPETQLRIADNAEKLINIITKDSKFCTEDFMQQFKLTTQEGIAVICLVEGLLRVPDSIVALELAVDKLSDKNWDSYLTKSKSLKAILASIGLYTSGKFVNITTINNTLTNLLSKVTRPVFLKILRQAINLLSKEFVFADNIKNAITQTNKYKQYSFAFDILGESARTMSKASWYYDQYIDAIDELAKTYNDVNDILQRPNLSIKFTAIYPKFTFANKEDVKDYLLPKIITLVKKAQDHKITITFDAEEISRLDLYLDILQQVVLNPAIKQSCLIGVVVQAYCKSALFVIEYIAQLAKEVGRKIPIRLVKGAYWDAEIKLAQESSLESYPVFTKKIYTDASYVACARKMLENDEYIFPQFATHNALTVATIIELAQGKQFEFQKLFGMGNAMHSELVKDYNVRIYSPVGGSEDLLAYLMRRILENGASACFVSKVKDPNIDLDQLVYNLHNKVREVVFAEINEYDRDQKNPSSFYHDDVSNNRDYQLVLPRDIYKNRDNPIGYNINYRSTYTQLSNNIIQFKDKIYKIASIVDSAERLGNKKHVIEYFVKAKSTEKFAEAFFAIEDDISDAINSAYDEFKHWSNFSYIKRANILRNIADLYEENKYELYSLLMKEAGKVIDDAINEVIEAIDFCRYYANQIEHYGQEQVMQGPTGESNILTLHPRGVFLCISPWNFPLAIFTGQIVAALVSGNTVIAKPAEHTPNIAYFAVNLMYKAGVPKSALQFLIAKGSVVGKYALPNRKIAGVVFTGSLATAQLINATLSQRTDKIVPMIAETGGQNSMIVDSSALLEQVVDDVLTSAFRSTGQRCSALRVLYIQDEIYDKLLEMIVGAMEILKIDDNSNFATDIGPTISQDAACSLSKYVDSMQSKGFTLIAKHPHCEILKEDNFFVPHILSINSIKDVPEEQFGPILHVIRYKTQDLDQVIQEINEVGFGLTFGIHSRVEKKIKGIASKICAGNIYINRSIIGAKVESQPFGGENKSGTGFKAGGPYYLLRFMTERTNTVNLTAIGGNIDLLR